MPGTTPTRGLRYPLNADPINTALDIQLLAEDVDDAFVAERIYTDGEIARLEASIIQLVEWTEGWRYGIAAVDTDANGLGFIPLTPAMPTTNYTCIAIREVPAGAAFTQEQQGIQVFSRATGSVRVRIHHDTGLYANATNLAVHYLIFDNDTIQPVVP